MYYRLFLLILAAFVMPASALSELQLAVLNDLANRTNMSNETLILLFDSTYNKTEINILVSSVNSTTNANVESARIQLTYDIAQVNSSVNLEIQKALAEAANSASQNTTSELMRTAVRPELEKMNQEFRLLLANAENAGVTDLELARFNESVSSIIFDNDARIRSELQGILNSSFMFVYFFIAAIGAVPVLLIMTMRRSRRLQTAMLGQQLQRKFELQDIDMSPLTKEKIENLRNLKNEILKRKIAPETKKALLRKVDDGYILSLKDIEAEIALSMAMHKQGLA